MKVNLKRSVLQTLNSKIQEHGEENILSIQLNKDEYINFLEELSPTERVLLTIDGHYKKVRLGVVE